MALLTPVLTLLLLGAVDLGRASYAQIAMNRAAYSGAQRAGLSAAQCASPVGATLRSAVENEFALLGTTGLTVACTTGADGWTHSGTAFNYAHVTISYPFTAIGPYGPLLPSYTMSRQVRIRVKP